MENYKVSEAYKCTTRRRSEIESPQNQMRLYPRARYTHRPSAHCYLTGSVHALYAAFLRRCHHNQFICNNEVITSDQSNLTTGRIAAAHGRFNGIRQIAAACTPCNTLPWTHPSPTTKRHLDRFSCFCTAKRGVSLYFAMGRLPQNCLFPWGFGHPT